MTYLFHVPNVEHPDHAGEFDDVKRELSLRQAFAVKCGFQRHGHELIHRPHHDGTDATEHHEVYTCNDVLVVVIRRE